MIIDLLGGTYEHKYKDWNSQRTINWFPKISDQKEKNKTQMALIPRSGLVQHTNIPGDSVRGMFTALTLTQERCFAVIGTSLWEISYDGSSTLVGALTGMATGSRSKVYMALNGNGQLMIQDTMAAYILELSTNVLSRVTTIDYPNGSTLDYSDGYFLISDGEGRVSFSELNDGFDWPGFNFFTPTYKPDRVKAIVAFREEVYCFGDETIEIYINDGTSPFSRQSRTSLYYGLTARDSIAVHHSGVFFLGKSRTGGSDVYIMGADYSLTPVSTPGISQILNVATNEDAEGMIVTTTDGHIFYHLHLPSLNTTLVYDVSTGMWHERQSVNPGNQLPDMYRGRHHVRFKGINLFGDWWSGKIFKEDGSTDDGATRKCTRISPVFHNELKYVSVYNMEFDVNSGIGGTLMVQYSKDGGNTVESEDFIALGALGAYDEKVQTNNLGTARNWVISFAVSDPVDVIVMQAVAHGTFGVF